MSNAIVCFLIVLGLMSVNGKAHASEDWQGQLQVSMVLKQQWGRDSPFVPYLELFNSSSDFLCISSRQLNPIYSNLYLIDANGARVPQQTIAEYRPSKTLGFDFNDSYIFLEPKKERSMSVYFEGLTFEPGKYSYEFVGEYYRCADIVRAGRIAMREELEGFGVVSRGPLSSSVAR